ncbi:MAG: DNA-3-methyladenine glycosylase [Bacteroidetes bacterium]|nr:DNA-3-methyladenine glycosylase [Bacteroidota bacterium]
MKVIPQNFYTRNDTIAIAKELLGKVIVTELDGVRCSGIIVETEAYAGPEDRACHAFGFKHTTRTAPMFLDGGVAYVYLIYGIYHLFNIVTNVAGQPHAVLIRAIEPLEGLEQMLLRRKLSSISPRLCAGPGLLSQALGITTAHTRLSLQGATIWLEEGKTKIPNNDIVAGTRVGVAYAGNDALLPYRFSIKGNKWVSKAKGL